MLLVWAAFDLYLHLNKPYSMRILPLVLFLFFFASCHKSDDINPAPSTPADTLATGWRKIALPTGDGGATDIFFIDNMNGYVIGGNTLNHSVDGGNTWQRVYRTNGFFENIGMGSAANAVITVKSQPAYNLLVTSNGGNSFDSLHIADTNLSDVFFVSPTIVYAMGDRCWKSVNGGLNWTAISNSLGSSLYRSLHFLSEQNGWCAGTGGLFYTSDAGVNWTVKTTPGFYFQNGGNVYFPDPTNGFIADQGSIGKSADGGNSWTKIASLTDATYHDLHFTTPLIGYATDNDKIYKTIDGGTTWTREVRVPDQLITEVHFTDANHGWANAGQKNILKYEK